MCLLLLEHCLFYLCTSLKFDAVLESATMDQHFFLTHFDLFLLSLWPVPLHGLIYFPCKTSGLSDAEANTFLLFKLLLSPLVPVLAAPLQCGCPNGPDMSGEVWSGDVQRGGFLLISFSTNAHRSDRIKGDVAEKKRKGDGIGQMCPLWLTGAEILALSLIVCLTLTCVSAQIILNSLKHAKAL